MMSKAVEEIKEPTVKKRNPRRVVAGLAGLSGALFLASCAKNAPQDTWQPKGENAQKIDDLQKPVFAIAGVVGMIVLVAVVVVIFRFKDRGQPIPHQTHGKPVFEITMTVIPALILAGVGVFTARTVFDLAKTDDTEMIINVTGQQWWWEYDYPVQDGISAPIISSGQLVIPVGTKVLLRETSRDVIHSYWIPALNGKRDAVPGRVHTLRLEADEPGIYAGQCSEFCGLSHGNMRMEAVALSKEDFAKWIDAQLAAYQSPTEELAKEGEAVFIAQCSRCHQVNGLENANGDPIISAPEENVLAGAAPNLTKFMSRNTFAGATWDLLNKTCRDNVWNSSSEEFGAKYLAGVSAECLNVADLRDWLRNAPAKKPMYADPTKLADTGGLTRGMPNLNLTEDDIDKLMAYLLTLK